MLNPSGWNLSTKLNACKTHTKKETTKKNVKWISYEHNKRPENDVWHCHRGIRHEELWQANFSIITIIRFVWICMRYWQIRAGEQVARRENERAENWKSRTMTVLLATVDWWLGRGRTVSAIEMRFRSDYHSDTVCGEDKEDTEPIRIISTGNLFKATTSQISPIDTGYWLGSHTGLLMREEREKKITHATNRKNRDHKNILEIAGNVRHTVPHKSRLQWWRGEVWNYHSVTPYFQRYNQKNECVKLICLPRTQTNLVIRNIRRVRLRDTGYDSNFPD